MYKKVIILFIIGVFLCLSPVLYAGDVLLIDDFSRSSFSNLVSGESGGDAELPGKCKPSFVWKEGITLGSGGSSLKLDFDVSAKGSFTFYWMKLGPELPDQKGITQPLDLTGYNYLSFWVKGLKGKERFKIELHQDASLDGQFNFAQDISSSLYVSAYLVNGVTQDWQKVVVPLKGFSNVTDWSNILELVVTLENRVGNTEGSIYIDDVLFGNVPEELLTSQYLKSSLILSKDDIRVNNSRLKDGFQFGYDNKLTIRVSGSQDLASLEGIRFDYSKDHGKNWNAIATDYDTKDRVYEAYWRTAGLISPGNYEVRAVAIDIRGNEVFSESIKNCTVQAMNTEEFLDLLSYRAFKFFWDGQDPDTGLFADATGGGDSNIGVCGFGLTALAIGAERGWVNKTEASKRALKCIRTFTGDPNNTKKPRAKDKNGFFYHFLDIKTAARAGKCEVSTIDTSLLICGALTAGEYFGGDVKKAADTLYKNAEWSKYLYVIPGLNKKLCTMGWAPERGFLESCWDYYTDEAVIISLLAIASPSHPLGPESFYVWQRKKGSYKKGEPFVFTWHGALFAHQYSHLWFNLHDKLDRENINWWENSRQATLANRQFVIDNSTNYTTYGPYSWGITSMDHPEGYIMHYGIPPCGRGEAIHDGTISPTGPAGSIVFTPILSIKTLENFYYKYPFLWGEYGLRDSFNLDKDWISSTFYGLGEGVVLLAIENFRSDFVWDNFMKNSYISKALKKAGFKNSPKEKLKALSDIDILIKEIERSEDLKKLTDLIESVLLNSKNQDDYNKLHSTVIALLKKSPFKNSADLNYLIAKIRFKQLKAMEKNDDLEHGRLYLVKADLYFDEIEEMLQNSIGKIQLNNLSLDAQNLQFIAYSNRFRYHEAEIAFQNLTKLVDNLTDTESFKVKELNRVTTQLTKERYGDYALKLRIGSIPKLSQKNIAEIIKELKIQADALYGKGNISDAEPIYSQYVELVFKYSPLEDAQRLLSELADQYFKAEQYNFAIKFYNQGLERFPKSDFSDYWQLKIATAFTKDGNYAQAIKNYEYFLNTYHASNYINEALQQLAKLYFTNVSSVNEAILDLKKLMKRFPRESNSDFIQLYIALLNLEAEDYKEAFKEFKSLLYNYPHTHFKYSVENMIKEVEEMAEEAEKLSRNKKEGSWRRYYLGKPIIGSLDPIKITTKPGGIVLFEASAVKDEDKYSLFEQDLSDISRTPFMTKVGYEDDLFELEWSATDGEFLTGEHVATKQWRAPKKNGQYEVSIRIRDVGLIRSPDRGDRDDKLDKVITALVTVKSVMPFAMAGGAILIVLITSGVYVFIKRKK